MAKPTLYLMLGYPGAGKTTTAKIIHELTGAVHLWADQIRNERFKHPSHSHQENLALYDHLNKFTEELLRTGQSVIFDTAFNFYKDRQRLREIAKKHGAKTVLIWVQTDKDMARERATHPVHADKNTYPYSMSEGSFERLAGDLELPREDETFVAIDGTKVSRDYIASVLKNE